MRQRRPTHQTTISATATPSHAPRVNVNNTPIINGKHNKRAARRSALSETAQANARTLAVAAARYTPSAVELGNTPIKRGTPAVAQMPSPNAKRTKPSLAIQVAGRIKPQINCRAVIVPRRSKTSTSNAHNPGSTNVRRSSRRAIRGSTSGA